MFIDEYSGQYSFLPPSGKFEKEGELWRRFLEFHEQNPDVYQAFKERLLSIIGTEKISSYEVRENMIRSEENGVDNNFAPYYLRTFIEEFPHFEKFFRLRVLKTGKI